ncbi:MAG: sulfotransferase, partial [Pirellulales bacterium]
SVSHAHGAAHASKPHPYPFWAPRFWHGMGHGTWLKLLARNRFSISPSCLPLALSINTATVLNSFAGVFTRLMFTHRANATKLAAPPLFVLGHWRSGTTLLHELLILDSRHTYPNTYECFAPHHFIWTEWFVPPLLRKLLPSTRPMDAMEAGWERPQEDEFALCNLGVPTPYLCWAFPRHGPVHDEYLDLLSLSDAERERWKRSLKLFVHHVAAMRNRRIILKSPTHTARIKTLLEVFPDARFVHIVRDPLALFPSTIRLWNTLSQVQGLQTVDDGIPWVERQVLDTFARMYERYEQDRNLIPAGRLAEVRYEDLIADPVGEMQTVYEQLELGGFARVRPAIAKYAAEHSHYRPGRYNLSPATVERVRRHWAPYFERYGYAYNTADSAAS